MRTKTLLVAAATIAAGALSSIAQTSNVYSLNIVGYANVSIPGGADIYANPLSAGVSNGANEVFSTIPDGSYFSTWDTAHSTFVTRDFDSSVGISPNNWYLADGITPANPPVLAPGTGFFLNSGGSFTNTFVGNVVPAPGTTNTVVYGSGGSYLVGSPLPVGGTVTNSAFQLIKASFPDGTYFSKWDIVHSKYVVADYDTSVGIASDNWYLGDGITPGPVPSFNVGQGWFMNLGGAYNWAQTLTNSP